MLGAPLQSLPSWSHINSAFRIVLPCSIACFPRSRLTFDTALFNAAAELTPVRGTVIVTNRSFAGNVMYSSGGPAGARGRRGSVHGQNRRKEGLGTGGTYNTTGIYTRPPLKGCRQGAGKDAQAQQQSAGTSRAEGSTKQRLAEAEKK